MQQYYSVEEPGITLTVFHTGDGDVSFDIEHYGGVVIDTPDALRRLHAGDRETLQVHSDRRKSTATLTRTSAGGLEFALDGYAAGQQREITVTLTPEQFDALIESLGEGDNTVGYPVEGVGRDGVRDRA